MKYFSAIIVIVLILILTQIEAFHTNTYPNQVSSVQIINETKYLSVPSVDINASITPESTKGLQQYNNGTEHPLDGNLAIGGHEWNKESVDDLILKGIQDLNMNNDDRIYVSWGDGLYVYSVDSMHVVTQDERELLSNDLYSTPHVTLYSWFPEYEANERMVVTGELLEYEVNI